MVLAIALAIVLFALHYLAEMFSDRMEKFHTELVSFSAGLFITFIFLSLLPEFFDGIKYIGENAFALMFLGFVVFHVIEKFVYQHIENKKELMKDLSWLHTAGFFINHFVIGIVLFITLNVAGPIMGWVIFIPLMLHVFSSTLSLAHIHEHYCFNKLIKLLLSSAPLFGVLFAMFLQPGVHLFYAIFSFVLGALLYIVIRDMIPKKEKGNVLFFIIGFSISYAIISAAHIFTS